MEVICIQVEAMASIGLSQFVLLATLSQNTLVMILSDFEYIGDSRRLLNCMDESICQTNMTKSPAVMTVSSRLNTAIIPVHCSVWSLHVSGYVTIHFGLSLSE